MDPRKYIKAPADREASIKKFKNYKTRIRCNSLVSALYRLTGTRPLPGRDSMYRQGAEIYSLSCLGMLRRNWEWGLIGKDIPEQEQREVPGPVWIDWAWPRTGIKLITSHFRQFWNLLSPFYIYIKFSLFFKNILSKWTKCAFQWCPAPNKDQKYLPKQDQESLSVPSLDCHSKEGASSWSCSINPNRTGNLSLLLPWTVSASQASLPGHLVSHFTGPFCYSCFSV